MVGSSRSMYASLLMRLDEKAKENLEPLERLLSTSEERCRSRMRSRRARITPCTLGGQIARCARESAFDSPESNYDRDDTLPARAFAWSIFDDDARDDLSRLRDLRMKADCWEDQVHLGEGLRGDGGRTLRVLLERGQSLPERDSNSYQLVPAEDPQRQWPHGSRRRRSLNGFERVGHRTVLAL
jgi:hypothetical protein